MYSNSFPVFFVLFCFVFFTQIILAIAVSWIICAVITVAGGFPSDSSIPQYMARTDARTNVLKEAKWFRFPYPGRSIDNFVLFHADEVAYVSGTVIAFLSIPNCYSMIYWSFTRSVGNAYCKRGRGVWDACRGVGLHYWICGRLLRLRKIVRSASTPKTRYQPWNCVGRNWLSFGGSIWYRKWNNFVQWEHWSHRDHKSNHVVFFCCYEKCEPIRFHLKLWNQRAYGYFGAKLS